MLHPRRDEVIATVRGWNRKAYPEMGWRYQRLSVGHYRWHDTDPGRSWGWVTLQGELDDAGSILAAIDGECAGWGRPRVQVDDSALDALLRPQFVERGWTVEGQAMLAWVGDAPEVETVVGVVVDAAPDLEAWSVAKLRGFSEDDAEPSAQRIKRERSLREAEEPADMARLRLARVEGEPVAVIGWYDDGDDVDIFNLATRLAWRRRGGARQLLTACVAEALADGVRSVLIGADIEDTPIEWYRRLGFSGELFTTWTYTPPA